ncbi:MAG: PEP-CTERM sorting domain-containing protein [Akkermansiaceae bacterium]
MNQIDLYSPGLTNYSHDESSPGYGTFGFNTYLDSQSSLTGNYVRYTGLTTNMFDLSAYHIPGASQATAINGIQIIGHNNIPEPTTGLLALIGAGLFALRRKRTS